MRPMRQTGSPVRVLGLTACLGVLALGLAAPVAAQQAEEERPLPAPVPVADDALTAALETGELTEAEYALERARSVFQLVRVRREFGDVERPSPRDVTLILRDLALRVDELAGADRATARRLLARPPDGGLPELPGSDGWTSDEAALSPLCGDKICVHWVDQLDDPDTPPPADDVPADGIPDWVARTLEIWEQEIWAQEITTIGYRSPQPDDDSDPVGDPRLDVYLDNLGAIGVFGYCTSDDPAASSPNIYAVSAYCVIDNDFAEFGGPDLAEGLMLVTSAHEFHHASQFAYDWEEDYWLMEGTATNMEETVYPEVDDNVNFLVRWSPLTRPGSPLDRGGLDNYAEYGAWIFWRFLEEKVAGDPAIIREIWERADASVPNVSPDNYSLQAVARELSQRRLAFRDVFAQFGTANRLGDYVDAQEAGYPIPPRTATFGIGPRNRVVGWRSWKINHLATRYVSFAPGRSVPAVAKLRIEVKLPKYGARATVAVVRTNNTVAIRRVSQGATGYARVGVPFGRATVKRIEVVLSNGSTRIGKSCWSDLEPPWTSCFGRPLDDNRAFQLRAQLLR